MLPDALPSSAARGVAGCRHGGKSELTRDNASSRLRESNPRPTHYERVQTTTVADGWCLRALGYSFQSVAGDGDDGRWRHHGAQEVGPQMSTTLMWSASGLSKVRKPALDPVSSQGGSAAGRERYW
jgi:hypothetical protein